MKKLWTIALAVAIAACNNDADNANDTAADSGTRPRPVEEGVTNSTKIVNDSVIVPDTNNTGTNPSDGVDTVGPIQKRANNGNGQGNNR